MVESGLTANDGSSYRNIVSFGNAAGSATVLGEVYEANPFSPSQEVCVKSGFGLGEVQSTSLSCYAGTTMELSFQAQCDFYSSVGMHLFSCPSQNLYSFEKEKKAIWEKRIWEVSCYVKYHFTYTYTSLIDFFSFAFFSVFCVSQNKTFKYLLLQSV